MVIVPPISRISQKSHYAMIHNRRNVFPGGYLTLIPWSLEPVRRQLPTTTYFIDSVS